MHVCIILVHTYVHTILQLLVWWFTTKISSAHNSVVPLSKNGSNANSAQNAASSLCDEIVTLWRLVALNPRLSPVQRDDLRSQLETWHIMTLDKVRVGYSRGGAHLTPIVPGLLQ